MSMRMKFAVVGVGQCGGNIANVFSRLGYSSVAINTSILDLKDLSHIPDARRLHIPLQHSDGAGKDPRVGEESINVHTNAILSAVEEILPGAEAILLTAGLGGGTGSNIALIGHLLAKYNLPIVVMATIPTNNEPALAKINALKSANRLVNENFHSCIIVDNEKILGQFPDGSLSSFYPNANEYVVSTFHQFNSVNTEMQCRSLISFDNEDFRKVLLSHGLLIFGETQIHQSELQSLEEMVPRLGEVWKHSGLMAEGYDYQSAAIGAVSIFAPASVLQRTSSKFLKMLAEEFNRLTNGATAYFGLYEVPNDVPVRITTMLGRMALPDRLKEMLQQASSEGESLSKKLAQALPELDISRLDNIDLFSQSTYRQSYGSPQSKISPRRPAEVYVKPGIRAQTGNSNPNVNSEPSDPKPVEEFRAYSVEDYVRLKKKD